ncbi:MAG: metallophosphoesterase [bacterium]
MFRIRTTASQLLPAFLVVLIALVTLIAVFSPRAAHAFTYGDTLTTIWRPIVNIPAIHTPAETLNVIANAPSGATGWAATLRRGSLVYPLTTASLAYDATYQRWNLRFRLPASAPDILYDLIVTRSAAASDTARSAVRLVNARKSSFYFLQISDTHLVTHLYYYESGADTDTSEMADFQAVIDDINLINPEYVVHTGDLINEGELEEFLGKFYWSRSQAKMYEFAVPFYLISGNHDIGGWDDTPPAAGTARRNWWRYFGWPYLDNPPAGVPEHSQNYFFDYGPLRMIGLEAYNNSGGYDDFEVPTYGANSFTTEQLDWLDATIASAPAASKKVAFYHSDFSNQVNTRLAEIGLVAGLWGHFHSVPEGNLTTPPYSLGLQSVCDGKRKYRLVRVAPDGTVTPRAMLASGATGQNLTLSFAPANNGTNSTVTATIVNNQNEAFEHALVRFRMPDGSSYQASSGTIVRQYSEGGVRHVHVNLPATALATVATTLSPAVGVPAGDDRGADASSSSSLVVFPAWPNPMSDTGRLSFSIPRDGRVAIDIFDVEGRQVATLGGEYAAGAWSVDWSTRGARGDAVPAGLYFARFEFEDASRTQKIVVLR